MSGGGATTLVVIPARWGSTRLPGKPLVPIAGRPMLQWVVETARAAVAGRPDVRLTVATDDDRIAALAAALGCEVAMTAPTLTSGSSRALAAAQALAEPPAFVVNVQGDAPFMPAAAVTGVLDALVAGARVATPVVRLSWDELDALREQKRATPFSGTTCIRDGDGDAVWFSKQIIPAIRDEPALRRSGPDSPVYRHLGLYGYTLDALARFHAAPPDGYETLEGLEQLRFLGLGIPIRTVFIRERPLTLSGIDTAEDVARAERALAAAGGWLRR